MKKNLLILIGVTLSIFLIILFTPLRYYNPPLEGADGVSSGIIESKERGVFLFEYTVENNPLHLRNGRIIHIKEAWAEKVWLYPLMSNKTRLNDPPMYNIRLTIGDKDVEDYGYDYSKNDEGWWIGIDVEKQFSYRGKGNLGIARSMQTIPLDKEEFIIYHGDGFARKKVDTLGILILKKTS